MGWWWGGLGIWGEGRDRGHTAGKATWPMSLHLLGLPRAAACTACAAGQEQETGLREGGGLAGFSGGSYKMNGD